MASLEQDVVIHEGHSKAKSHTAKMGVKRDRHGNTKQKEAAPKNVVRNAYTPMFEQFRDELDEHHDRRERIVKASRDVTALSKKIIFSLQRVRKIHVDLPDHVQAEVDSRMSEAAQLLASIAGEVQGINRWRYVRNLSGVEELIEAMTFAHYLRHQSLMTFDEAIDMLSRLCEDGHSKLLQAAHPPGEESALKDSDAMQVDSQPTIDLSKEDYLMGVFDLSGEMMRFATVTAALNGELASASEGSGRTIVGDMQELGSFFEMLPQNYDKTWRFKMETLGNSVRKVEKLGYGLVVRGSERPKGWMPDTADSAPGSPV